jgi:hypothetical protein
VRFRGSCQINFEEFLEGSLRLNGAAKRFDGRFGNEFTMGTVGSWSYFANELIEKPPTNKKWGTSKMGN